MKSKIISWNRPLKAVLIIAVLIGLSRIAVIDYLLMQASGQFDMLWNARPIAEVLADDTIDEEFKINIRLIDEIKAFAETELGLHAEGLYHTIYDQKGKDILWNLSACEPFELNSVEWYFPIVGSVSYKGFFDLEKAKKEEQQLRQKGYDTRIRPVNAWSTLGWFADPVLSNNLKKNKGEIAELFIHEITHANIFIKDSLTFNENLASFIGEQAAEKFLISKFGLGSEEHARYVSEGEDMNKFIEHCLFGLNELGLLYNSFDSEWSVEGKQEAKDSYLRKWVSELDSINFHDKGSFQGRFKERLPNNAFFMAFDRYDSKKKYFDSQLNDSFDGDLKSFIDFYKQLE